jgi:GNAT superfamily N-acetyltransferase
MNVVLADQRCFDDVYGLLSAARKWHLATAREVWPAIEPEAVSTDIDAGRVFVFSKDEECLATVTITDADPLIWDDVEVPAFYLHKLASKRDRAGEGIGSFVLNWAKRHALEHRKQFLRLDTWATNLRLKNYYESQGFAHVRTVFFSKNSPLPDPYRGSSMNLFEMPLTPVRSTTWPPALEARMSGV